MATLTVRIKCKMLLVGGYPKGYDIPFHPHTLSGKRLRKIVKENNLNVEYFDIFKNEFAEKNELITLDDFEKIHEFKNTHKIIALGFKVYYFLFREVGIECEYLPHPASRRKQDLIKLEQGLKDFNNAT